MEKTNADRNHPLCFEWFRSERNRQRAAVSDAPSSLPTPSTIAVNRGGLTARQVAHRERMLAFSERARPQ